MKKESESEQKNTGSKPKLFLKLTNNEMRRIELDEFYEFDKQISEELKNNEMKTQYLGSYIKRLIQRATNNHLFENNTKGSYRIEPQHGLNFYKYNLYKNSEFLATFSIYEKGIFGETNANKKEQKEIFSTLKNLYPNKQIIIKEI